MRTTPKRYVSTAAALLALLAVGVLAAMAAPRSTPPPTHGQGASTTGLNPSALVPRAKVVVGAVMATVVPPTPTDTPAPAPTATLTPSWHIIASYSGTGVPTGTIGTLSAINMPVRILYTCPVTSSLPVWGMTIGMLMANGASATIATGACDASHTSGTLTGIQVSSSMTLTLGPDVDRDFGSITTMGAWTLTFEGWY